MPEDEHGSLEAAQALLAECPAGRELLDIAAKQGVEFKTYYAPYSGSRGYYVEKDGERTVALNRAWDPTTFLCALIHELEHAKQSHDGFFKLTEDSDVETGEKLAAERTQVLLEEAGAMAKVAVVLCQLYQLGWEQPERREELQRPLREALTDYTFADLYAKCHREHRQDLQSLYNGQAFEKTAAIYIQDSDRFVNYLEGVEEGVGKRYLQDQEFRGEVIGDFHAGLPAVTRSTRWELLLGVARPRPLQAEISEPDTSSRAKTPLPTWEDAPNRRPERRRGPDHGY